MEDIYIAVKTRFRDLCDDDYLCPHFKRRSGTLQPEWKHIVRSVLAAFKRNGITQYNRDSKEWTQRMTTHIFGVMPTSSLKDMD
jgi:hypothetical protein